MNKELDANTVLSHYRIVSKIGAGGMGEVYLAEDTKLERQIALKILLAEVAGDPERVQRFVREAKAASALNHPNILTVFEIGTVEGSQYIATELIKGETLRDLMNRGRTSLNDALGVALQVAAALGAAHEAGIVHRDIKPENIMIREDGLVKVLDFGLAKLTEKRDETASSEDATKAQFNTQPGLIMGTAAYMSPEQARGRDIDARSDIFSLGIVMYELFSGKRPFDGDSPLDLISSILKDDPPALRQVAAGLPRHLERIVDKTLRKDREYRYQHVKDLRIDLEDLRDELKFEAKLNKTADVVLPAQVTNIDGQRTTLTTSISTVRRFTILHAMAFVIAGIVIVGAIWYFRSSGRTNQPGVGAFKVNEIANWSSAPGEIVGNARFSPDGKLIAFASTRSGTKNIWVTQASSTDAIQITNDAFSNTDPVWSAVGNEIAFFSQRKSNSEQNSNVTGVWRVSALGGGSPKLVGPIADGSCKLRRWAASGKVYYESNGNLFAIDISGGTSQQMTSFDKQTDAVKWINISADEKLIAYVKQKGDGWEFFISDITNSNPRKFTEGAGSVEGVVWLPETGRLLYGSAVDGVIQIFAKDSGSSQPLLLTSTATESDVVDATPDGGSIIFSSAKEESNLWGVSLADALDAPIARDLNSKLWPSVAADNSRVVFQSVKNLNGGNNLFESAISVRPLKARSESENSVQIAERGFLPAWSPDGSSVAFLRKTGNNVELFTANANGGGERRLASGGIPIIGYTVSPYNCVQTTAFAWSPDGSGIAFVAERNGTANIWLVSAKDGTEQVLTDNADPAVTYTSPVWTSDGKRIAALAQKKGPESGGKGTSGPTVVDIETRSASYKYWTPRAVRLIGWAVDEKAVIIAETEKWFSGLPPETLLKKINADTGSDSPITKVPNAYFYNIFLSGDRKNLALVARNDEKDDIWIVRSDGGASQKLTRNNDSGSYFSRLAWVNDGSAIIFGKQTRFSLLSMMKDTK